jgi:hypothetical protein
MKFPLAGFFEFMENIIIEPFHKFNLVWIFLTTLSIHAVLVHLLEQKLLFLHSVMLTFPMTVGITIIMLVLIRLFDGPVKITEIIAAPLWIAFVFWGLAWFGERFGLRKTAEEELGIAATHTNQKSAKLNTDLHHDHTYDPEGVRKILHEIPTEHARDTPTASRSESTTPKWIRDDKETYMSALGVIRKVFVDVYERYGWLRLVTGILLGLFLAFQVQGRVLEPLQEGLEKKGHGN